MLSNCSGREVDPFSGVLFPSTRFSVLVTSGPPGLEVRASDLLRQLRWRPFSFIGPGRQQLRCVCRALLEEKDIRAKPVLLLVPQVRLSGTVWAFILFGSCPLRRQVYKGQECMLGAARVQARDMWRFGCTLRSKGAFCFSSFAAP